MGLGVGAGCCVNAGIATAGPTVLTNNIVVNLRGMHNTCCLAHVGLRRSNLAGLTSDNNLVYTPGTYGMFAEFYTTLADWRTGTGRDLHSIVADPLFLSNIDLHIVGNSPARGAGLAAAVVTRDIDGQLRDDLNPDIGADELPDATALISGRIVSALSRGIRNARVTLSGGGLAQPIEVLSGRHGFYTFSNLPTGQTYAVTVSARRFILTPNSRSVPLETSIRSINFTGQ
jgi:hypothetical protein